MENEFKKGRPPLEIIGLFYLVFAATMLLRNAFGQAPKSDQILGWLEFVPGWIGEFLLSIVAVICVFTTLTKYERSLPTFFYFTGGFILRAFSFSLR